MISNIISKNRELIAYFIVGVFTTLVNLVVYYLFTNLVFFPVFADKQYVNATVIAWVVAVTFAFLANKFFVFRSDNSSFFKEAISFYLMRLASLVFDILIMVVLVDWLTVNQYLSKVVANVVIILVNYLFSKLYIFKKK